MGEMSLVKPRLSSAAATAAVAAWTAALAARICSGCLHSSLCRLDLRLRSQIALYGVVEVLIRDGLLLGQRDVTVFIELRFVLIRFRHGELRFRLDELGLRLR